MLVALKGNHEREEGLWDWKRKNEMKGEEF